MVVKLGEVILSKGFHSQRNSIQQSEGTAESHWSPQALGSSLTGSKNGISMLCQSGYNQANESSTKHLKGRHLLQWGGDTDDGKAKKPSGGGEATERRAAAGSLCYPSAEAQRQSHLAEAGPRALSAELKSRRSRWTCCRATWSGDTGRNALASPPLLPSRLQPCLFLVEPSWKPGVTRACDIQVPGVSPPPTPPPITQRKWGKDNEWAHGQELVQHHIAKYSFKIAPRRERKIIQKCLWRKQKGTIWFSFKHLCQL